MKSTQLWNQFNEWLYENDRLKMMRKAFSIAKTGSEHRHPCVLVITNKYVDRDPRIAREVSTLLESGYKADIICLRRNKEKIPTDLFGTVEGFRRFSLYMKRKRRGRIRYMLEYFVQYLYTFVWATSLYWRHRYDLIQVFVMPEFLVLSCLIPKLMGAKILMDWEDPMREVYMAKFPHKSRSLFLGLIGLFEKIAVHLADHIITPNEGFRKAFVQRGVDPDKLTIVMNAADTRIFGPARATCDFPLPTTSPILLYAGGIVERQGLDIAIRALEKVVKVLPESRLVVLGSGEQKYIERCRALAESLDLANHIEWRGEVQNHKMPEIIRSATVGVIPNRNNEFTRINFPTRIMELALLRRPIVVSRLPDIEDYLDDTKVFFFTPEDANELADRIIQAHNDPTKTRKVVENAYKWSLENGWDQHRSTYLRLVNALVGRSRKRNISMRTIQRNTYFEDKVNFRVGGLYEALKNERRIQ